MFKHLLYPALILLFGIIFSLPGIIIGSVGVNRLMTIQNQRNSYINTSCFVVNITDEPLPYDCNCEGCQPATCYAEHFTVRYQIANKSIVLSMINIDQTPELLDIRVNNNYTCFYDQNLVTSVVWIIPNERLALVMVIVGFTISVLIIIMMLSLEIKWIVQNKCLKSNKHVQF